MVGLTLCLLAITNTQMIKLQSDDYLVQQFIEKEKLLDQEKYFYLDNKYDTHDFTLRQEKLYAIYVFDWLTYSCKQLTKSIQTNLYQFLEWVL